MLDKEQLARLARLGAETRIVELDRERAELVRAFPHLRTGAAPDTRSKPVETSEPPARRRHRRMSRAQRKAVSARMKRYWAERRARATKGAKTTKAQRAG